MVSVIMLQSRNLTPMFVPNSGNTILPPVNRVGFLISFLFRMFWKIIVSPYA